MLEVLDLVVSEVLLIVLFRGNDFIDEGQLDREITGSSTDSQVFRTEELLLSLALKAALGFDEGAGGEEVEGTAKFASSLVEHLSEILRGHS